MKLWGEEQKAMTLYETVKGKTESHDPIWNQKGKNRKSKCPEREEQKIITPLKEKKKEKKSHGPKLKWMLTQFTITLQFILHIQF